MRASILLVVLAAGCGKTGGGDTGSATASASPSSGSAAAVGSAHAGSALPIAIDAGVPMPDPAAVSDLPPFSVELAAKTADLDAAEKLNVKGLAAHKKKTWPAAFESYTNALKKDPGNVLVRYNLASAYHSSGDDTRALALLAQFKQPDCRLCNAILLAAKTDPEWQGLADNAQFKAITGGVAEEQVDLPKLTGKIAATLEACVPAQASCKSGIDELVPYVNPHAGIREGISEMGEVMPQATHYGVKGFHDFVDHGLPAGLTNEDPKSDGTCDKNHCCSAGTAKGREAFTERVCYSMIGGLPFISQIVLNMGPPI